MRPIVLLTPLIALGIGCATPGAPGAVAEAGPSASGDGGVSAARTWRLGFWELDLLALDLEPRGTTFRLLDLRILKLLEVGAGDDYYSFALLETPGVIEPLTVRRDGAEEELRLVDVQALALLRRTKESARREETRVVKPPLLRALYGHRLDGPDESREYLFLFRQEVER